MRAVPQPSRATLHKAWQLGQRMATTERRLMPQLGGVHQYTSYAHFVSAHRHRLEQTPVFQPWDAALQQLAEQEGHRLGLDLDDPQHWDKLHALVAIPLRAVFWKGWEHTYHLEKLYSQQIELYHRQQPQVGVLRIHNPPQSPLIPCSPIPDKFADDDRWDSLLMAMVDRLDDREGETFWHLPDPAAVGEKPQRARRERNAR